MKTGYAERPWLISGRCSCRYRCPQYPSLVVLRESFKTYKDQAFIVSWARKSLLSNQQPVACVWRLSAGFGLVRGDRVAIMMPRRSTWWQWRPSRCGCRCGQCELLYTPVNGAPAQGSGAKAIVIVENFAATLECPANTSGHGRRCVPATSWACSRER
jgi:hypothetical protein